MLNHLESVKNKIAALSAKFPFSIQLKSMTIDLNEYLLHLNSIEFECVDLFLTQGFLFN